MVVEANGPAIPRPHRLSFHTGTYTNYDDTDDEEEDRLWNAMTPDEQRAWRRHRLAVRPPPPGMDPAERRSYAADRRRVEPDFEIIRPFFGYAPADVVKNTFRATTQFARNVVRVESRTIVCR